MDWVIGRTFYVLEECLIRPRRVRPFIHADSGCLSQLLPIEMPICTKFVYDAERVLGRTDIRSFSMGLLRIPKLCELDLNLGFNLRVTSIWKESMLQNINLSGIKVLRLSRHPVDLDIIDILERVPSVERLTLLQGQVLAEIDHELLRSFVTELHRGAPVRIDTRRERLLDGGSYIASVLCPKLRFFVIKGVSLPIAMGELVPILKAIVDSRATVLRSPLNSLKVYPWEKLDGGWVHSSELGSIELVSPNPTPTNVNGG